MGLGVVGRHLLGLARARTEAAPQSLLVDSMGGGCHATRMPARPKRLLS